MLRVFVSNFPTPLSAFGDSFFVWVPEVIQDKGIECRFFPTLVYVHDSTGFLDEVAVLSAGLAGRLHDRCSAAGWRRDSRLVVA